MEDGEAELAEDVAGRAGEEKVILLAKLQVEGPAPVSQRVESFRGYIVERLRDPDLFGEFVRHLVNVSRTLKVEVGFFILRQ